MSDDDFDRDRFLRFVYEQSRPENRIANVRQRILREFLLPLIDPVFSMPATSVEVAAMLEDLADRFRRSPATADDP